MRVRVFLAAAMSTVMANPVPEDFFALGGFTTDNTWSDVNSADSQLGDLNVPYAKPLPAEFQINGIASNDAANNFPNLSDQILASVGVSDNTLPDNTDGGLYALTTQAQKSEAEFARFKCGFQKSVCCMGNTHGDGARWSCSYSRSPHAEQYPWSKFASWTRLISESEEESGTAKLTGFGLVPKCLEPQYFDNCVKFWVVQMVSGPIRSPPFANSIRRR